MPDTTVNREDPRGPPRAKNSSMAKYGLFHPTGKRPLHVYEGDYMKQSGEYVAIFKRVSGSDPDNQVAAIRLDQGYSVRDITGETFAENTPSRAQVGGREPGPWSQRWRGRADSNRRPKFQETLAIPSELRPAAFSLAWRRLSPPCTEIRAPAAPLHTGLSIDPLRRLVGSASQLFRPRRGLCFCSNFGPTAYAVGYVLPRASRAKRGSRSTSTTLGG